MFTPANLVGGGALPPYRPCPCPCPLLLPCMPLRNPPVCLPPSSPMHRSSLICGSVAQGPLARMTGDRAALLDLRSNRHPVRLANAMVTSSECIGSIWFLSSCGSRFIKHDIPLVPLLATSPFSNNRFTVEHKSTQFEVMEDPERRWINSQTKDENDNNQRLRTQALLPSPRTARFTRCSKYPR